MSSGFSSVPILRPPAPPLLAPPDPSPKPPPRAPLDPEPKPEPEPPLELAVPPPDAPAPLEGGGWGWLYRFLHLACQSVLAKVPGRDGVPGRTMVRTTRTSAPRPLVHRASHVTHALHRTRKPPMNVGGIKYSCGLEHLHVSYAEWPRRACRANTCPALPVFNPSPQLTLGNSPRPTDPAAGPR